MTTCCDNVNNNEKVKSIRKTFNNIQSDHLKNVFKNSNTILAQKQPKKLLCLLQLDLILTPIILYNQRGYLNIQINTAKFFRCT